MSSLMLQLERSEALVLLSVLLEMYEKNKDPDLKTLIYKLRYELDNLSYKFDR